jgi:hypothetical protein
MSLSNGMLPIKRCDLHFASYKRGEAKGWEYETQPGPLEGDGACVDDVGFECWRRSVVRFGLGFDNLAAACGKKRFGRVLHEFHLIQPAVQNGQEIHDCLGCDDEFALQFFHI